MCGRADDVTSRTDAARPRPVRRCRGGRRRRRARGQPQRHPGRGPGRAARSGCDRSRRPGRPTGSPRSRACGSRSRARGSRACRRGRCHRRGDRRSGRSRSAGAERRRHTLRGQAQGWPRRRPDARSGAAGDGRAAARRGARAARGDRGDGAGRSDPRARRPPQRPVCQGRQGCQGGAPGPRARRDVRLAPRDRGVGAGRVGVQAGHRQRAGRRRRRSRRRRDSRCESLLYGVAHSNNAIVGKLAFQKLAPSELTRFAHQLGVAEGLPGAELRGTAGAVDIPAVRDLNFAQAAAGFTGSRLSAVGGALLAATFADDGEQPAPRLVASIDGVALPAAPRRRAVASDVARSVGRMMLATCEFGSAARSFGKHQAIRVAGKTGTLTRSEPFYMEHSWFVGYAPVERPQIIVSVVLGNPENWHLRGHEAARRLIDRALAPATGREKNRTAKIGPTRRVGW
ncbi:MAG: hypothetical protein E6J90_34450 [Deltaproteobacteria bacterium]|nr:MAG: hypothetical protein E6J90_34450 [Deltaproteobacteria bacterium]